MPSLQTVGRRFESELYTESGFPFPGVVLPLDEGAVAAYDFTEPRLLVRVRHDSPVHTGTHMMDPVNRKFIMAHHDQALAYDTVLYRTHCLFQINKTVEWKREDEGSTDLLTGLKRSAGLESLGMIDVLIEQYGREQTDVQMRIAEQRRRMITTAAIRLGDIVDNMVVKRLDQFRGIWLAEIE